MAHIVFLSVETYDEKTAEIYRNGCITEKRIVFKLSKISIPSFNRINWRLVWKFDSQMNLNKNSSYDFYLSTLKAKLWYTQRNGFLFPFKLKGTWLCWLFFILFLESIEIWFGFWTWMKLSVRSRSVRYDGKLESVFLSVHMKKTWIFVSCQIMDMLNWTIRRWFGGILFLLWW